MVSIRRSLLTQTVIDKQTIHIHILKKKKKNKGADVLDFDCTIFFPKQDNANHFLLISSSSRNTVKFQNRQNDLFFTKDVWAIPLKAIFFDMPHRLLRGS